jgi:hypothetical protein
MSGLGRLSLFQSRSSIPSHLVPQVREPELSYHLRLLEFQASGTDAQVLALPFLNSSSAVERYAYFECAAGAGNLVSGTGR